eukprot:15474364-Alexandrium_andersonii.AAC.1
MAGRAGALSATTTDQRRRPHVSLMMRLRYRLRRSVGGTRSDSKASMIDRRTGSEHCKKRTPT